MSERGAPAGKLLNRRTEITQQAVQGRTSVPINTKSDAARIPCGKCDGYMGERLLFLPGEVLQTASRGEKIRKLQ